MIEAKEDVTDGPDDKQIDAIPVGDGNGTVYIIQGKFIGQGGVDAEPLREGLASWIQLKDLARLQETGKQKLKRRLSEVAIALDDEYNVSFELIVTGPLTSSARDDLATFQARLAESDGFPAAIHLVDTEELQRRYEMALERENPLLCHTLQLQADKYMTTVLNFGRWFRLAAGRVDSLAAEAARRGRRWLQDVNRSRTAFA